MQGSTHVRVGVALGAALVAQNHVAPVSGLAALVLVGAALGALVPDIDHAGSRISRAAGVLGAPLRLFLAHRGFTHSLAALLLLVGVLVGLRLVLPALAFLVGYASHILADMLTVSGVRFLWPARRPVRLLPGALAVRTGGRVDQLVGLLAFLVMCWLLVAG